MTNGKPTRVSMISSIANRNQGGGPKKQALVPNATHYFKANSTGNQYNSKTSIGYTIGGPIPQIWYLYKAVGSTTKINGMRVFSN